jgi:hypothetical protein
MAIQDTFVETSDTAIELHTPTPSGGFSWAVGSDDGFHVDAATNKASPDSTTVGNFVYADVAGGDFYVQADISQVKQGPVICYDGGGAGAEDAYSAHFDNTSVLTLGEWVAGSLGGLDTGSTGSSWPETVKLYRDGNDVKVDFNASVADCHAVGETTRTTGLVGMMGWTASAGIDQFDSDAVGSGANWSRRGPLNGAVFSGAFGGPF